MNLKIRVKRKYEADKEKKKNYSVLKISSISDILQS